MKSIIFIIYLFFYLLFATPALWRLKYLQKHGRIEEHDAIVRRMAGKWAKRLVWATGSTVDVRGLENIQDKPAVYVCNHLSYFDIPVIMGYMGDSVFPLLAKDTLGKIPLLGSWMRELHCVFIDRDNPRQAVKALKEAEDWVSKGYSMIIFPEGTRSLDGEVHEFKSGAFKIAQKNKVPVVPMAIWNTQKINLKGSLALHAADVKFSIMPPIDTEGFSRKDWRGVPKTTHDIIADEVARERKLLTDGSEKN